ncbi:DUF4352 domain-containing protein [Streptomyces muensis]|uniref:DUF4352 domain-containing protein n=1 Tax=Streptomyces muensis TaxID=1077944 RepID=A0A9X1Q3V5_STRM4|nr:DUF4352 domain-containing protein [Streptomyces muensis]MCF1597515.1 DUF4352 domain-containing protein [Streptomyces muensis]
MRHITTLTAALLLAGLTVGCSSKADEPTVSKATTPPTSDRTPSPSPSPTQETYKLGDTIDISNAGFEFSVAALAFKDEGITSVPGLLQAGEKWAVVEVKVCNTGTQVFSVSPFPWSLAYEDGARVEATGVSGGELPPPEDLEEPIEWAVPKG